jgi:serine/threonine protein kinase
LAREKRVCCPFVVDVLIICFCILPFCRIVFRDLKPENVAFDRRNTVQIFDFGLAKECKPVDLMQAPDGYQMTGMTGTLRIMAPEVIANTHYGLSSDVYSFGILLWEVFACEPAHLEMDFGSHVELVVHQNVRPRRLAQGIIPDRVQYLAEECWSADPSKRPSFEDIQRRLEAEIIHVNGSLPDRSRHLRSPPPELPISTAASPKRNSMKDTIVIGVDGELAVVGVAVKQ